MHTLVLLMLLQASPSDPRSLADARIVVVKGLDALDADIGRFAALIETRFDADAAVPKLGIVIESSEDVGADGLHSLTVQNVVRDGPADTAGVRAGDRILAVGPRRITHETEGVFRLIADNTAGSVRLTLRRGGTDRTVIVNRAPLACLQRSSGRIDMTKWHATVAELRRVAGLVRTELDDTSFTPTETRYRAAKDHVVKMYGLIGELGQKFSDEMLAAASAECTYRSP